MICRNVYVGTTVTTKALLARLPIGKSYNGNVKMMGIEVKGPSKLIILTLGVGLIITGAKIECRDLEVATTSNVPGVKRFTIKKEEIFRISKANKPDLYFQIGGLRTMHYTDIGKVTHGIPIQIETEYTETLNNSIEFNEGQRKDLYEFEYSNVILKLYRAYEIGEDNWGADFTLEGDIEGIKVKKVGNR